MQLGESQKKAYSYWSILMPLKFLESLELFGMTKAMFENRGLNSIKFGVKSIMLNLALNIFLGFYTFLDHQLAN